MATIQFQGQQNANATFGINDLGGSGLGFFGSTAGSSVQIGSYNDSTYVSNADGSVTTDALDNWKFVNSASYPSGSVCYGGYGGGSCTYTNSVTKAKSRDATFGIEFNHTTAVKVQNAQLRIYDRANINYPASGVNTKVCEIVNFNGSTNANQGSDSTLSAVCGSGDAFWWGEPWPSLQLISTSQNYYTNSVGTKFYNGTDADITIVNGDARLGQVTGDRATVGGTGIVVPLLDSPGSGQKYLHHAEQANSSHASNTGLIWPKFTQYLSSTSQASMFGSMVSYANGHSTNIKYTYGGTGVHTHHTWCIGISATPLAIGSKEQYGLYVSLEYL